MLQPYLVRLVCGSGNRTVKPCSQNRLIRSSTSCDIGPKRIHARCYGTNAGNSQQQQQHYQNQQKPQRSALEKSTKNLLRVFDSEIKVQQNLIDASKKHSPTKVEETENDEAIGAHHQLDTGLVIQQFKTYLDTSGWAVRDVPGTATIEMKRKDADGMLTVRFDIQQVVDGGMEHGYQDEDSVYNTDDEDVENEVETTKEIEDEYEDDLDEDQVNARENFPIELEIRKQASGSEGKFMLLECIAELDGQNASLSVENMSILSDKSSSTSTLTLTPEAHPYEGPEYGTLDETLRQQIDDYVNDKLDAPTLVRFISAMSRAKESREYLDWLQTVRSVFAP